ncbi:hypothetical protein [Streptomyces sp. NPDC029526]|uniref:hypothetical protein n=1 Tax=Streptomyces sp. NPDC029526 TaxID=3155728 RepID=UPI0033D749FE
MHQPPHHPPLPKRRFVDRKGFRYGCLPAIVVAWVIFLVSVLGGENDSDTPNDARSSSSPSAISPEARESIRERAGLPPEPDLTTRQAYLADLDAIDTDIVHGKGDKAVSRGLNQCSSFKMTKDGKKLSRAKLVEHANYRFTSPNHPNGHGTEIAEQILDVVHKHLCPDF